LESGGLPKWS